MEKLTKNQVIGEGCYGTVVALGDKAIKVGDFLEDVEFHRSLAQLKEGLTIFPKFYGVEEFLVDTTLTGTTYISHSDTKVKGMVTELIKGASLEDIFYGSYKVDAKVLEKAHKVFLEELQTLAKEHGIIVQDLHSSNVMYQEETQTLKVVDVGLWVQLKPEMFYSEERYNQQVEYFLSDANRVSPYIEQFIETGEVFLDEFNSYPDSIFFNKTMMEVI